MVKNNFLKEQFSAFSNLSSEEEKKKFWEKFAGDFNDLKKNEQSDVASDWKENMQHIDQRLKEISNQIDQNAEKAIKVFPANDEELILIKTILTKMNINFT